MSLNRCVFLDRDGVLNLDNPAYTYLVDEFKILPGVIEAVTKLKKAGFVLVVVTNQSGISKSIYTREQMEECHAYFQQSCSGMIDRFYFSPYHRTLTASLATKPGTLMFEKAIAKFSIDVSRSWMVGDRGRDILPARLLNIRTIQIGDEVEPDNLADYKTESLLEAAQKQMNDPAQQAQMKEMQAKMNDPQMKAMMESNPQMKAQIESMMKMQSGGGDMISSMIPKSMTVEIKNQNTLTKMEGGMAPMDILFLKDKNQLVSLNRSARTYTILPSSSTTSSSTQTPKSPKTKVTKTSETAKILNYTCTKYLVEMTEAGKTITNSIWATTEIKDFNLNHLSSQRVGSASMSFEGIDGVPLKMEMNTPEMKMMMEATEIKKQALPASDFIIPADYKEVKGMGMMAR